MVAGKSSRPSESQVIDCPNVFHPLTRLKDMEQDRWKAIDDPAQAQRYLTTLKRPNGITRGPLFLADQSGRIIPGPPPINAKDIESNDVWGFEGSSFQINEQEVVEFTGDRYELAEADLPFLLPWAREVLDLEIDPKDLNVPKYPPEIPEAVTNDAFLTALGEAMPEDAISSDDEERLRRGHGHTQEEMYRIKYDRLDRIPDLVVWPQNEDEVESVVSLAAEHDVCLIPYGGGTSVTEALMCPINEARMIVSVDMKRMNRIRWIEPVNRMACIEAGAVGRHIMEQLAEYGFTMGHEPDSIEFSTMGGWVATHASGMKKNRYGNIEDLLLDVEVITPVGRLPRTSIPPRESIGMDPRRTVIGSEGNLGIITTAVVKIYPLPEAKEFASVLFPDLESGVAFMYDLQQAGNTPASVRLVDNLQFQFGQALKHAPKGGVGVLFSKFQKWFVLNIKGFDKDKMTALTVVYEGSKLQVKQQKSLVNKLAKRHGGMSAGSGNGERGYQLTFAIAYIRDWLMNHWLIAESFETSLPWSQAVQMIEKVKERLLKEHDERGITGRPFISARVTQIYDTGVCVYFYYAFHYKGMERPWTVYAELENIARSVILEEGGSLSHHHGIGKIRRKFMPDIMSDAMMRWNVEAKKALDPQNIFGSDNHLRSEEE